MKFYLSPQAPIQRPVLDSLSQMLALDSFRAGQVRDRSGYLEHPIVRSRAQVEFGYRLTNYLLAI